MIRGKIGTILFSLAFLVIVNDKLLHLEAITPWPVLGAALLGTIGMKMLFPGAGKHFRGHLVQIGDTRKRGVLSSCSQNGSQMEIENAFGQAVRLISGEVSLVKIENAFGAIQVYFNDACPIEGKVVVDVSDAFGKTEIYVPASWKVIMDIEKVFGNCEECGNVEPGGDVMIHIAGGLAFGNLSIIHV